MSGYKINIKEISADELSLMEEYKQRHFDHKISEANANHENISSSQKITSFIITGAFALILNVKEPKDFCIATKKDNTIEQIYKYNDFVNAAAFSYNEELEYSSLINTSSQFLSDGTTDVIELGMEMFSDTKPMSGLELKYLSECIAINSVTKPTLKNRL